MVIKRENECQELNAQDQALVRVGPMIGLFPTLLEHGCDPEPIFNSYGFKPTQFENPDFEIPFIRGSRLFADCVKATGCEHFGLSLGMRTEPSALGIAGFMLQTAYDVNTALHALIRHYELHDQGSFVSLKINNNFAFLGYGLKVSGASATEHIYDLAMTVGCKIMRGLCGEDWNPTEVMLARPHPQDPSPYKRFFKTSIRFDAEENAVVFPTHWLQHKLPNQDPLLFDYLEGRAAELHLKQGFSLINKLHRFLHKSLVTGDYSANTAAQHLGIHERTLSRRLHELDTNFRKEINEVRYTMARNFLATSQASTAEIALALGYADAATFSRSFKRWSGMSPTQWRRRHS